MICAPDLLKYGIITKLLESLISSVFGLNVTPKNAIVLPLTFPDIFLILSNNNFLLRLLDLITVFTIDRSILYFFPVETNPLVSFGKQDPP